MASSSAGIGVAAHYDVSHNWHYVVRGAKRFELWRPGHVAAAALPFAHPGFRSFALVRDDLDNYRYYILFVVRSLLI